MIDWYSNIKRFYERKLWTKSMVGDAVFAGKITEEQYKEITGEDYVAPDVAPFSAVAE